MIAGHITCTYLLYRWLGYKGIRLLLPAFLLGAILPDIIDKTLSVLLLLPSRGIGHSLLVVLPLIGLSFLVFRGRFQILTSLQLGVIVHLLEDMEGYYELLWPFMYDLDFAKGFVFSSALYDYYVLWCNPISLLIEAVGTLACACLLAFERLTMDYASSEDTRASPDEAG